MADRAMLETMLLIRAFEAAAEKYVGLGKLRGTTHGCVGQEIIPAALMRHIDKEKDAVYATHRCHGYFIAWAGNVFPLAAEMMGKAGGSVHGAGGSQHLNSGLFYTNGITGGMAPVAVGTALAARHAQTGGIVVDVLGDGGFNEGYVQEALNMAAVYRVPLLFLLENNRFAMSTRSEDFTAGTIQGRVESYNMAYRLLDPADPDAFDAAMGACVEQVRATGAPLFAEVDTFRFCGHSKSDPCAYMDAAERQRYLEKDPLGGWLASIPDEAPALRAAAETTVADAFARAEQTEEMGLDEFAALQKGARFAT